MICGVRNEYSAVDHTVAITLCIIVFCLLKKSGERAFTSFYFYAIYSRYNGEKQAKWFDDN